MVPIKQELIRDKEDQGHDETVAPKACMGIPDCPFDEKTPPDVTAQRAGEGQS
jgi:hypothetical protein